MGREQRIRDALIQDELIQDDPIQDDLWRDRKRRVEIWSARAMGREQKTVRRRRVSLPIIRKTTASSRMRVLLVLRGKMVGTSTSDNDTKPDIRAGDLPAHIFSPYL